LVNDEAEMLGVEPPAADDVVELDDELDELPQAATPTLAATVIAATNDLLLSKRILTSPPRERGPRHRQARANQRPRSYQI
jgi:hypothetical protein